MEISTSFPSTGFFRFRRNISLCFGYKPFCIDNNFVSRQSCLFVRTIGVQFGWVYRKISLLLPVLHIVGIDPFFDFSGGMGGDNMDWSGRVSSEEFVCSKPLPHIRYLLESIKTEGRFYEVEIKKIDGVKVFKKN